MSMTRRDWLTRVFGVTVAAAVAPLVDLTDTTPEFWNQPPIKKLLKWWVEFPDGTRFGFSGTVLSETLLDDGSVSLSIQPDGPPEILHDVTKPRSTYDTVTGNDTVILQDDVPMGELVDVRLPALDRVQVDVADFDSEDVDESILGLTRRGALTVNFTKI